MHGNCLHLKELKEIEEFIIFMIFFKISDLSFHGHMFLYIKLYSLGVTKNRIMKNNLFFFYKKKQEIWLFNRISLRIYIMECFFLLNVTCKNCLKLFVMYYYRIVFPFYDNMIRQQKKAKIFFCGEGCIIQK